MEILFLTKEIRGIELFEWFRKEVGVDVVSGLPCGELREFIEKCYLTPEVLHIQCTNERESIGVVAGAWLAGKQPLLYMQNSGLFLASNDITSILIASGMPIPMVVSWRGTPGETATQHLVNGKATVPLLKAIGLPFVEESTPDNLKNLMEEVQKLQLPGVVLQKRIRFNTPSKYYQPNFKSRESGKMSLEEGNPILSREDAIDIIMSILDREEKSCLAFFSSTGLISRSIYERYDGPNHFYNAGGFGLTSSIALGFSLARPDVKTIIIEGDGSVLANLGNLNLIGYYKPQNLIHIVLNNGSLVSCSGEPSLGSSEIVKVAGIFGYKKSSFIVDPARLREELYCSLREEGPILISVKISQEGRRDFKRPVEMKEIAWRFRIFFKEENGSRIS